MLGAIIGDIVGSRWEFNPTNDYHFELFSDENGFTDDTICTIAVDVYLYDGRLLLLAPWPHQNERISLTRAMCLALNKMAEDIVKRADSD